ncbi:MAG: type I methionyl aminopeptidase [Candidatus Omnitrophota bacterium]
MIPVKSKNELKKVKQAGVIVAKTLKFLAGKVKPGVTTKELDADAALFIEKSGGKAAFLGYHGFPAHICVSINEEVVHGIPSGRMVRNGDIVSLDVGVELEGYFADAAITVPVGKISKTAQRLLKITKDALYKGIAAARCGRHLSDISFAIQNYVEKAGFSVVRDFVGHGIGLKLHEEPQIPNFGKPGQGVKLEAGMVLAIEPMINAGGHEVEILPNGWTAVTRDREISAHFEHDICITDSVAEIFTI